MPVGREATAARRRASRLAQGAVPLTGLRAAGAQGRRETCQLAVKLPPLGDRPRGSRKGQCPLIPDCALCAQGRRGICQLAGVLPPLGNRPRGSPVWSSFVLVDKERPPFGGGPHGSLKGQRMKENTLPFCVAGISKIHRSILSGAVYVWIVPTAEEKIKTVFCAAKLSELQCHIPTRTG